MKTKEKLINGIIMKKLFVQTLYIKENKEIHETMKLPVQKYKHKKNESEKREYTQLMTWQDDKFFGENKNEQARHAPMKSKELPPILCYVNHVNACL